MNDVRGHGEGDRLLRDFARLGGDEFALLLVDCDADAAYRAGQRLQGETEMVEWSFGVAEWQPGEEVAEFIHRAEMSMLVWKQRRKGHQAARG